MVPLKIGELARRCGVNLDTVRYYERRGLLLKAPRSSGGYRSFSEDAVRRLRFIKHAQVLGFTLAEIKELLSLRVDPQAACADVCEQAERKVRDIEQRIASLQSMKRVLAKLSATCASRPSASACPILEALEEESPEESA